MDFRFTEEQKSLIALIKDFGEREVTPEFLNGLQERPVKDRMSYAINQGMVKKVHGTGLRALPIPEKYGGVGADLLTLCVVCEALAQYAGPASAIVQGGWSMSVLLADFGTEEQRESVFTRMLNDPNFYMGPARTEPDHGCDPRLPYDEPGSGMKTYAYRDGDEYVINGEKCFIAGALNDLLFVYLRTDRKKPLSEAMSIIMVPTNTPGYSVQRVDEFLGDGMRPHSDCLFNNVRVPVSNLVGKENKGFPIFHGHLIRALVYPASIVGTLQKIYELTKEYAKMRVQGGKPIFEHLTVGTRIVDMYSKIEDLRLKVYKAAWEYDQNVKAGGSKLVNPLPLNLCVASAHELEALASEYVAEIWSARAALKGTPAEGFIRGVWGHYHEFETPNMNRIQAMGILDGSPYLNI